MVAVFQMGFLLMEVGSMRVERILVRVGVCGWSCERREELFCRGAVLRGEIFVNPAI